ncbi:thioesterase family protein [Spirillospora sp. NPDC047279]|uniref:thioesterase family protein n=1 Tax=Spirillospora sp. NPDC047279 TaxID=3155478 RepID=UPI0033CE02DC
MAYHFDCDTEAVPRAAGVHDVQITGRWQALHGAPLGSYALAAGVRALGRQMVHPEPLAVSAHFLRPVEVGPAEVRTEIVRTGRRMATGEAHVWQGGKERLRAVATFTDFAEMNGRTATFEDPPRLPPPGECVDPLAGVTMPGGMTLLDRVEFRMAGRPGWLGGAPGGTPSCDFWMRFRDGREPDALALVFLWDVMAPMVLEIGEAPSTTLEATVHIRGVPAPGWLACRVATSHVTGGLCEEDMDIWDSRGRLVAQSRQLTLLR